MKHVRRLAIGFAFLVVVAITIVTMAAFTKIALVVLDLVLLFGTAYCLGLAFLGEYL